VPNDVHFQAYLLEGVSRWNEDRAAAAAVSSDTSTTSRTYSDVLRAAVNQLIDQLLGERIDSGFHPAKLYTGKHLNSICIILELFYCIGVLVVVCYELISSECGLMDMVLNSLLLVSKSTVLM